MFQTLENWTCPLTERSLYIYFNAININTVLQDTAGLNLNLDEENDGKIQPVFIFYFYASTVTIRLTEPFT